ncbi:MAG: anaerobic ribonucleoside-triphosphate reductase activating protein [Betaproteobacteria bacterium]|uniref:anaerobic ribonucleoside-triphosphate reductase activating protein n=1 Tax=Thiomonas sp. FB-Cd TaxID=1158292 RepID=UPI000570A3FA|nr:anaerobic ribonucleoside-triphosphate reductase activating protein [Thiomonas sp. FB-Cd]MDE2255716.1 anaerobic ribonucleoside-triphosphate reductase activating protein [Betaproteobacteria bacterium]
MDMLRVGGITALTTIDFPGRLAAVVFCQGCPWRCGYCHNPNLLDAGGGALTMPWAAVMAFLERRRGLLDGVVFSGGEPTLQAALPDAMQQVRRLGFEVALHTAGMYPERLATVLHLIDWVGLDVKAPWLSYDAITGVPGSGERARESLRRVLTHGVAYECRTTWHPGLFSETELLSMGTDLAARGVRHWVVQACRLPGQLGASQASLNLESPTVRLLSTQMPGFALR